MSKKKVLILDYSTDKSEAPAIKRWLPADAQVSTYYIDTEESFPDDLIDNDFTHVIHSGSALSITKDAPFTQKAVAYIQDSKVKGVWQYGICYGHQLVCLALVGNQAVRSSPNGLEVGWGDVKFTNHGMRILGVGASEAIWQSHFDEVIELPDGSELLATNTHTEIQAFINFEQKIMGTQFHPEFDKEAGDKLFLEDRELLESNNYNLDEIITRSPSIEAGKIFFGYFLQTNNLQYLSK
ncbi:type 1 glutamine amidotransferase [Chloroflexota bacterium]